MRKRLFYQLCLWTMILSSGCSVTKTETAKVKDLDFDVISEEKLREELKAKMDVKKDAPFKITYKDKENLYIARAYGKRKTNGYSVEVVKCYETANAIYIHTNLIGPSKEEKVIQTVTNPQIAVRLKASDKNVVFE